MEGVHNARVGHNGKQSRGKERGTVDSREGNSKEGQAGLGLNNFIGYWGIGAPGPGD